MIAPRILLFLFAATVACDFLPRTPTRRHDVAVTDSICTGPVAAGALPRYLRETSGVALGSHGRVWTHNDGDEGLLFALDATGRITQRVRVEGVQLDDWEDLESVPCDGRRCLYIADIGDNDGKRGSVSIHVIREPAQNHDAVRPHVTLRALYPDGAQDAEGLIALPDGSLYIVTKGRHRQVALYRVPPVQPGSGAVTLERVRELAPQPADSLDRVSAATATPDGAWIALRTYQSLLLYPAHALLAGESVEPHRVDLSSLRLPQSEAVALDNDGTLWLTSEHEHGGPAAWARMQCRLR